MKDYHRIVRGRLGVLVWGPESMNNNNNNNNKHNNIINEVHSGNSGSAFPQFIPEIAFQRFSTTQV